MSNVNYKFSVVFFKENSGREPVRDWIKEELDLDERKKLGKSIEIIQERWPLVGFPLVRPLVKDLSEIRVTIKNRITRIIFVVQAKEIILLHGFIKKSQKTPQNEIETALARLKRHNYL